MRILHVIKTVDYSGGGPIEGLTRISEVLVNNGHTLEVASLDLPSDSCVSNFPRTVYGLGERVSTYGYSSKLLPWLKENAKNYDIVLVNGLWQYHGFAVWKALHNKETPYAVFTHGMLDPWFKVNYPLKHIKKWLYWPWADYRLLRDASAVFFTSEEEKVQSRKSFWLYKCHEQVIGYGTSIPKGDPQELKNTFLKEFPQLNGKQFLLFLGRIHEKKGCDLLISAFAKVADLDHSLCLVMAGPDQMGLQSELMQQAESKGVAKRIVWTGMLKGEMKLGAYYAADVFVLPSHQENFGIAVAEALACGLPVLISNKVNIWREIEKDGAGIIADDTLEGTIHLLESWLRVSFELRQKMRLAAYNTFITRYEIGAATHKLLNLYMQLIEKKANDFKRN